MINQRDLSNDSVVLLEFPDEAESYLEHCRENVTAPTQAHVVSLDPKTQVWLDHRGVPATSSLPYFDSGSHARALRKSDELFRWLEPRFQIRDSLGISDAYTNALLWYSRFFIHHMLWLAEILTEVHAQHPGAALATPQGNLDDGRTPLIKDGERYLGPLAEMYCHRQEIPFQPIMPLVSGPRAMDKQSERSWLRPFAFRVGGWLHRTSLRRMGKRRPFLAITHGYRGDSLVEQTRKVIPDIPWVIRGEKGGSLGKSAMLRRGSLLLTAGLGNSNGRLYMGEIWLRVLQESMGEDQDFAEGATQAVNQLADEVEAEKGLFSHREIFFGDHFAAKLRTGIGSSIRYLQREIAALDEVLDLVKPRMVVTPFGRRSLHALGELSRRKGIPGLLISHGSFTPMKTELEEMGWRFHSHGLLHGTYSHSALQTPLAEAFAQQTPAKTKFVKTGPLIWGMTMERRSAPGLKEKLAGAHAGSRIVVHAGTPKSSRAMHFHVYETPDEYIAALRDLVLAVESATDVFLIIKYRPTQISEEELRSMLPKSDRFCISVEESFLDVLGISDMLVSFSSTTIEEAFQNRVPVLLYGGGGRYQHVEAPEVAPGIPVEPGPVYSVRHSENLAEGLTRILDTNGKAPLPAELFRKYVYRKEEITPLPELVGNLLASNQTGGKE